MRLVPIDPAVLDPIARAYVTPMTSIRARRKVLGAAGRAPHGVDSMAGTRVHIPRNADIASHFTVRLGCSTPRRRSSTESSFVEQFFKKQPGLHRRLAFRVHLLEEVERFIHP